MPDQVCGAGIYRFEYSVYNVRLERLGLLVISVARVRTTIMYVRNRKEVFTILFVPRLVRKLVPLLPEGRLLMDSE